MTDSPGSYDPAEESHRALRVTRQELERRPIITTVRGFPAGKFTQLIAHVDPNRWRVPRENATVTVRWFAGELREARPEFSFHYSDEQTDLGWHHHDQEHVDGWGHFEERTDGGEYVYESHSFPAHHVIEKKLA